jgi:predicted nucleic acid-binding protein
VALDRYLADASVWARIHLEPVARVVVPLVDHGLVGTCGVIDLEILYSARSGPEHARVRQQRRGLLWLSMPEEIWERAVQIQAALASRGAHRAASISDLLVAATAERHALTVLHYDGDYDLIASVTSQATQWVVPRGSVP